MVIEFLMYLCQIFSQSSQYCLTASPYTTLYLLSPGQTAKFFVNVLLLEVSTACNTNDPDL